MLTTGTGPRDWWQIASQHASAHTAPIIFSFDPTVRMTVVTACMLSFFWTICTHGSDQVVLQRYFSTNSLGAARRSYLMNAATDLTIGALLALCGLALLAFYLQHPSFLPDGIMKVEDGNVTVTSGDKVLPYFFAHQLPAGVGGVVLAVLLCDAMQTLVSGVNSISAVFTNDLFRRLVESGNRRLSDLNLARLLSVAVGLLVTVLGLTVAVYTTRHPELNIVDMMAPAFNMFLGPLACLFLIGMFLNCPPRTAIIAVVCSMLISFAWSYSEPLSEALFGVKCKLSITLTTGVPYVAGFVIAAILGAFDRDPNHPGLAYTWKAVMRRKDEND
jgi:SSS family solute:Na+ symporter